MNKKMIWIVLLVVIFSITAVGLGLSAYNYYVFDKPFVNDTTEGLLSAFVIGLAMILIGLLKEQ